MIKVLILGILSVVSLLFAFVEQFQSDTRSNNDVRYYDTRLKYGQSVHKTVLFKKYT
jgi:hypothetical protein